MPAAAAKLVDVDSTSSEGGCSAQPAPAVSNEESLQVSALEDTLDLDDLMHQKVLATVEWGQLAPYS